MQRGVPRGVLRGEHGLVPLGLCDVQERPDDAEVSQSARKVQRLRLSVGALGKRPGRVLLGEHTAHLREVVDRGVVPQALPEVVPERGVWEAQTANERHARQTESANFSGDALFVACNKTLDQHRK